MSYWYLLHETIIQTALIYLLVGLSVQVAMRTGTFSLAGVGFWGISAYATGYATIHGFPWLAAMLLSMLACVVLSVVIFLIIRRLEGLYMAMATMSFALLVVVIAYAWTSVTGGAQSLAPIPSRMTTMILAGICLIACLAASRMEVGAVGRAVTTLGADPTLSRVLVPSAARLRFVAFGLSAALGSLSGSASALTFNVVSPTDAGFSLIVTALTVVIIGGVSTWWGPVLGAFIVAFLPEYLRFLDQWRQLAFGALLVLFVVWAPGGIVGLVRSLWAGARELVGRSRSRSAPRPAAPTAREESALETQR